MAKHLVGNRLRLVGVVAATMALGLVSACGSGFQVQWKDPGGASSSPSPTVVSSLSVTPDNNAGKVAPGDPVKVAITNGKLDSVSLVNAAGRQVQGLFDATQQTWSNSEPMGYSKKYTLSVKGTGVDGHQYDETRTFTTVTPENQTLATIAGSDLSFLKEGATYGVGQIIAINFDEPISDKAAAERLLTVTTDPQVVGAWSWRSSNSVHWRPEGYWPAHTKVKVDIKIFGHLLGKDSRGRQLWGQEDESVSFTIGDKRLLVADAKTHLMKVYVNDQQVTKINGYDVTKGVPVSLGKNEQVTGEDGAVIDFRSYTGKFYFFTKEPVHLMSSANLPKTSPNYYKDVPVKLAMRFTDDGLFVHMADWNIPAHGHANTSHGCVNVGPRYQSWIFNTFDLGDVVEVTNTGVNATATVGVGYDWNIDWAKWKAGSALTA